MLYFPRQIHFFMLALEDFFREAVGISWHDMLERDQLVMPTVNVEVTYSRRLEFGDEAEITVGVGRLGEKSLRIDYQVTHLASGETSCVAKHTMAFVDGRTWKTVPVPDVYRKALSAWLIS